MNTAVLLAVVDSILGPKALVSVVFENSRIVVIIKEVSIIFGISVVIMCDARVYFVAVVVFNPVITVT